MSSEDYYKTLGLEKTATDKQIHTSYRKLAMKYHPDKNTTNNNKAYAEEMFKKINEANEILSDPDKRKIYDSSFPSLNNFPNSRTSRFASHRNTTPYTTPHAFAQTFAQTFVRPNGFDRSVQFDGDMFTHLFGKNIQTQFTECFNTSQPHYKSHHYNNTTQSSRGDGTDSVKVQSSNFENTLNVLNNGSRVILHSLSTETYNDLSGNIISYDGIKKRYNVKIKSDTIMSVKHSNLYNIVDCYIIDDASNDIQGEIGQILGRDISTGKLRVYIANVLYCLDDVMIRYLPGMQLKIINLKSRTELNDTICIVKKYDITTERYIVEIQSTILSLKYSNLTI